MTFSIKDIANAYGYSRIVTKRHILKLIEKETFIPSSMGKRFNESDCQKISILLGFPFDNLKSKKI